MVELDELIGICGTCGGIKKKKKDRQQCGEEKKKRAQSNSCVRRKKRSVSKSSSCVRKKVKKNKECRSEKKPRCRVVPKRRKRDPCKKISRCTTASSTIYFSP
ncbi:unnamed protein product [Nezara viridula]|uniref:Uncharacterized protein n=1 Tax=Nezara viridula TaxID=85310 RepID=A0A9P0MUK2_NEZVI|nr:unnamed protein product [Nezara viridula]